MPSSDKSAAIKKNWTPKQVCDALGVEVHNWKNGKGDILCPWHDDTTPSCGVSDKGWIKCMACGKGADVIALVQQVLGIDFKGAVAWFETGSSAGPTKKKRSAVKKVAKSQKKATKKNRGIGRRNWQLDLPVARRQTVPKTSSV